MPMNGATMPFPRILVRRHDQILKDLFFLGFQELIVDRYVAQLALGAERDPHHAAARLALDLKPLHLGLHGLDSPAGLGLLHQTQHIAHH